MRSIIFGSLVLVVVSACASVPSICRPGYATQAGRAQALRGEQYNPSQGSVCQQEHYAAFQQNFRLGYQQGKQEFCSLDQIHREGQAQGEQGQQQSFLQSHYAICDNPSDLRKSYTQGYQQGLEQYCSPTEVAELARAYGEVGRASEFELSQYQICGNVKLTAIEKAYKTNYEKTLGHFCQGTRIEQSAFAHGKQGEQKQNIQDRFAQCSPAQLKKLIKNYELSYAKGFQQFCHPDKLHSAARENASVSRHASLPESHQKCLADFPDLISAYESIFERERRDVVNSQCTFDRGRQHGSSDANSTNFKNTKMPVFCEETKFGVFLSGYMEGWGNQKQSICESTDPFSEGTRDGRNGNSNRGPTIPVLCPSQYHARITQRYHEGYQVGISQRPAPSIVVVPSPLPDHKPGKATKKIRRKARKACLARGFSKHQCKKVSSLVCIERGYQPSRCQIEKGFLPAVEECLSRGFSPNRCQGVSSVTCLERGYSPSQCRFRRRFILAIEACLARGYSPSSCRKVKDQNCIERGYSPSQCHRKG